MLSQSQAARFAAISKATRSKAANDAGAKAPLRGTLGLQPFMAKIRFDEISAGTAADGAPFFTMPDVEIEKPDGTMINRTVTAFGEAHRLLLQVVCAHQDLEVELTHAGATMTVTGVVVDGAFRKIAPRPAQAA